MRDFGLREEIKELTAYVLGASKMPYISYVEDGDWRPYKPPFEHQAPNFETSACTAFTVENQIQFFMKAVYGEDVDLSENFLALSVPIGIGKGADPQRTYEAARHVGMVDSNVLRMGKTEEEWSDQTRLTKSIQARGLYWLRKHDFFHEWLWDSPSNRPSNYMEILKDALKTSPIGISVSAWETETDQWGNEVYVSRGDVNNHKTLCVFIDDEGYPWVYDSYQPYYKRLSKDHNIRRAKRIWINKRTVPAMKTHIKILQAIINMFMQKKTWVQVCEDYLGSDASPRDLAPDELGCSETMTTLMQKVWPEVPVITGTYTMKDYLDKPSNGFVRTTVPVPGTIILCATGTGNGSFPGHTGTFMNDMTIASNDSRTGRFIKNYDLDTWTRRYVNKGGFQIFLYNRKV